jgi:pyruvate formate lyase activating enzyme
MNIKGLTTLSLVDWDGEACSVIFVGGCPFRCPSCHNSSLVINPDFQENIQEPDILQTIEGYLNYISGICITGGEPCMQRYLPRFCRKIKKLGLKVKIDTNGMYPLMIDYLLKSKLVDYIAMDVKAPLILEKYSDATNTKLEFSDLEDICRSIDLIKKSKIDYEFRTTLIPTVHTKKDIEQICKYAIKGAKKYVIQNFWNSGALINPDFKKLNPLSSKELMSYSEIAMKYIKNVKTRNLGGL